MLAVNGVCEIASGCPASFPYQQEEECVTECNQDENFGADPDNICIKCDEKCQGCFNVKVNCTKCKSTLHERIFEGGVYRCDDFCGDGRRIPDTGA